MSGVERKTQRKNSPKRPTVGMLATVTHADQLMWLGAADYARAQDINLICLAGGLQVNPGAPGGAPNMVYHLAHTGLLDALIVWGSANSGMMQLLDERETNRFMDHYRDLPLVNVEKPLPGIPCVFTDTYTGMRQILDHLIEAHGRRRIALIRGPAGHFENEERTRAWVDALEAHGLVADESLLSPPSGWNQEDGEAAMQLLLDERHLQPGIDFDALATTEVQYAVGALTVLQQRGVSVPDEVSVVGFNDIAGAEIVAPAVTTVEKPFYESGRVALRAALDLLQGTPVPGVLDVPAEMVIRRSCGCWPGEILTAGFEVDRTAGGAGAAVEQVVPALTHVLESIAPDAPSDVLAQCAEQLVLAFDAELIQVGKPETPGDVFLSAFENVMRKVPLERRYVSRWHWLLSVFRERVRPTLADERIEQAEAVWQQARTLVAHEMQRAEMAFRLERANQNNLMSALEQRMSAAQDIETLMAVIGRGLPGLGIRSGYLALYQDPTQPLGEVNLWLAWRDLTPIELPDGGRRYPFREFLPPALLPADHSYQLAVLPLYIEEQQFGFIVMEFGPTDGSLYVLIQREISSALQNVLLVEQRRQIEAELARERALLRTLIDNIPDYVYIKDRQSRFLVNNAAHIRMLGAQSQDALFGKTDFDIFPREFAEQYYESEQAMMARDEPLIDHQEEAIDQSTGNRRWVLTTKVPLHDAGGSVNGFVGVTRDITAIKQAEEELAHYAGEMERRATQIQTASEVARDATSVRDLGRLLSRVVHLLVERLGFDHAMVFLVDDTQEYVILMAASGEAGQEMLSSGRRVQVGQEGLIGRVAATGQFRLVSDVRRDAQHQSPLLLPGTHAEAVLPLQVGGQVIGVLDIQSNRVNGIDDSDVAALNIVADQLAVAIENVRLLDRMQQTVQELEISSAQYTREAWQRLSRSEQQLGYRYRRLGVEPAEEQTTEAQRALQLGSPVVNPAASEQGEAISTVAVPVRLRDQVVGVLNLRFAGAAVSPDVLATIEQVSNRLALSMESTRLLRDTQLRAVRDRVLSEASARIGETLDVHTVLRRAVQEMRSAMGLREVEIRMGAAPHQDNGKGE